MIQRIQTLFLLLGAISSGFISMKSVGIWEHFAFAFASLGSLVIISLYKRRRLQLNLCLALVIPLYITGILFLFGYDTGHYDGNKKTSILISFFVGLLSTLMAVYQIHKDEKIVKESNRLR